MRETPVRPQDPAQLVAGVIKNTNQERGFGFIKPDPQSKLEDVFFHFTALDGVKLKELQDGTPIVFVVEQTDRGPRGVYVAKE
jgi:cold shock CspA family protein